MPRLKNKVVDGVIIDNPTSQSLIISEQKMDEITALTPSTVDLHRMIDAAVSEDDWVEIFRVARMGALNGSKADREFLTKYRFGLPAPVQPTAAKGSRISIVEIEKTSGESEVEE